MNERQFRERILPLHRMMYAYALAIVRNDNDAQDCVQEAFTRLWESRRRLDSVENHASYALSVVRNVAVNSLSVRKGEVSDIAELHIDTPDADALPDRLLEAKDDLGRIEALMDLLPDNQRRVIALSSVAGLTNDEIMRVTGFSSENVRVLLSRGRKKLREMFHKIHGL